MLLVGVLLMVLPLTTHGLGARVAGCPLRGSDCAFNNEGGWLVSDGGSGGGVCVDGMASSGKEGNPNTREVRVGLMASPVDTHLEL